MKVEDLIQLHYEPGGSTYSPEVIEAVLQKALAKTPPERVLQIAKSRSSNGRMSFGSRGGGRMRAMAPI